MLAACAFRSPRVCLCIVLLALVSWSARVWGAETERVFRAGAAAIGFITLAIGATGAVVALGLYTLGLVMGRRDRR